ncbi:hypothetical protein TNCV_3272581 [Trichonephila clavipes]|nr:hypothetical protein TNCV_3272581 [Trichonephila clavipes]
MSSMRPLLRFCLTGNHKVLRRMGVDIGMERNYVYSDESRFCLQYFDGRMRVYRHRGERLLNGFIMYDHCGPAPMDHGLGWY